MTVRAGAAATALAPFALSRVARMTVAAFAVGLVLLVPSAAHAGKSVADTFGGDGSGPGQFHPFASGMAVHQATGDVYVMDPGQDRVQRFDAGGGFLSQIGPSGAGTADFAFGSTPGQVAVDQFDGSLYVTDWGNNLVKKFSSTGQFVDELGGPGDGDLSGPRGVAVDPTSGDVYVADSNNNLVKRFSSAGVYEADVGAAGSEPGQLSSPTNLAVDSTGDLYVVDSGNNRVQRFDSSGAFDQVFGPAAVSDHFPSEIVVDTTNDHVYVVHFTADLAEPEVFEYQPGGDPVDAHAFGLGPNAGLIGLAVNVTTGRIYVGYSNLRLVLILDEVTPPEATIDPVTAFEAHTATFSGTVDPNGTETGYHFEYSTDGTDWTPVPVPDASAGEGSEPVPVSVAATGLSANTAYRVRLVASKPFGAGSNTSDETTFTTDTAPPSVETLSAGRRSDTEAELGGRVNPENLPTSYWIEYGTTTGYGSRLPVGADADAGSGGEPVAVFQRATGLQPQTTYHYRVVARNAAGTTEGEDRAFTTRRASPTPPPGRAYEMVSPLDKNGGHVDRDLVDFLGFAISGSAPSGDAVAYPSRVAFGDIESANVLSSYVSRRGATGWATEGIVPPIRNVNTGVEFPAIFGLSPDLSKAFVVAAPPLTQDAELLGGSWGLYVRDRNQPQRYHLLSRPWTQLPDETDLTNASGRFQFASATPDSRHAVFISARQLLPDAPPDSTATGRNAVYEWADGSVRLVSVLPPGVTLVFNAQAVAGGSARNNGAIPGDHLISDDGRRIFFTVDVRDPEGDEAGDQLFVREDATQTHLVSASERAGDDPMIVDSNPRFWAARAGDGAVALFANGAPLTDGAGRGSLYRWDANAPDGQRLTELSSDPLDEPGVLGPAAVTDDARTVYFVARGVLAPDATRGEPNLYLWREGQPVRFVATLDEVNDAPIWALNTGVGGPGARLSADGERLLFASYAPLDPFYDTTEATPEACGDVAVAGETCRQIYLYDARSDTTSCLTCVEGAPVTGDANFFGNADDRRVESTTAAPPQVPRNLSADGKLAFFETARRLVPEDRNGRLDVYQWHEGDVDGAGDLRLVSSGLSLTDSKFVDASPTGRDVFFTTRDRLVGIDVDNQIDTYDARIGGGIPEQSPPTTAPPCEGDSCQGPPPAPPALSSPGSGSTGAGNRDPGKRASFSVRGFSAAQRAKLARGDRAVLAVRVSRPGRVSASAKAKLGKRMRTVASAAKRARRAGTVRLALTLSKAARRRLASEGRLRVSISVRFAGTSEVQQLSVRLRRAVATTNGKGKP